MNGKLLLAAAFIAVAPAAMAQSLAGRWDATVTVNGLDIPFRFDISGDGAAVKGTFFNGDVRFNSTGGRADNGSLTLNWDYYASRYAAVHEEAGAPKIGGNWIIPTKSPKGESAWHFIVNQKGSDVSAAILRIDGDTGAVTGSYTNGKFVLSHFSGTRPLLLEVTPQPDGSLAILQNKKTELTAVRAEQADAKGVAKPTDP